MISKTMKKLFLILIAVLIGYFFIFYFIGKGNLAFTNLVLSSEQKNIIKKFIFPYKKISQQEVRISALTARISRLNLISSELAFKNRLENIVIDKVENIKLSKNIIMKKYKIVNGFYTAIDGHRPGGYIDFHQNNLIVLSSRGILGYNSNLNDKNYFKQIRNNINNFIGFSHFSRSMMYTLRDLYIHEDKIFISYMERIKDNCSNVGVIYGSMNYENIDFKKLFSSKECVMENGTSQSGGRITNFNDNHVLLSVGEFNRMELAQDKQSINGKIIRININNSDYEIISMGHRNPQGLYFDKENNFILETEHGPHGGDEINIIEVDNININQPLNYGWAMASAGDHYPSAKMIHGSEEVYKKFPLYKSHSEHGFIEPLKSFVPSIGISEITKIGNNRYVLGSMGREREGDKSLYFFELNSKKKLINLEKVKVFDRVRDLIFNEKKLYLFFENPISIGVISLN